MSRPITQIVIHCSASPNGKSLFRGSPGDPGFKTPIQVIDEWHKERGFKRSIEFRRRQCLSLESVGYHFVIYTNGTIVAGRHVDEVGAHVAGNNKTSLGLCLVGTDKFTPAQWATLASNITGLQKDFPNARICGHRDLSPDKNNDGLVQPWEWLKTCPGFDVRAWLKSGMQPPAEHVLDETK
jgi:N-acetylmuramoyl-L-alanine amidase